jgi:hypothetical protein
LAISFQISTMSNQEHSTTQAHEQPQTPGTPPDEHPADLRSRPNDAHNEHKASDTGLDDVQYPPQLHAGKVGIGPHYHEHDHVVRTLLQPSAPRFFA